MLIRSQDKKTLINLDLQELIRIGEYQKKLDDKGKTIYVYDGGYGKPNINCYTIETKWDRLAEYSTEAKASKVLDMIQQRHDSTPVNNWTFEMSTDGELEEG